MITIENSLITVIALSTPLIIAVLGETISEKTTNTPLFYIYNDGTVEKKIIIE